jgi:hypothetical protein
MNQATTSLMTSASSGRPRLDRPISLCGFNRWLFRVRPGDQLEYHRGHLVWDRRPTSILAGKERRQLGRLADAALRAAEDGLVHLVQRRNGPFDFSYIAIKASCRASAAPAASPPDLPAAA